MFMNNIQLYSSIINNLDFIEDQGLSLVVEFEFCTSCAERPEN